MHSSGIPSASPPQIALLTVSYPGDLHRCNTLCASIDRLMPDMRHYLVVERRFMSSFAHLETASRQINTTESLLPEFLRVRSRDGSRRWLSPYRLKLSRPWDMQQYIKLAAVARATEQAIVVVDSDVEFIRPLEHAMIIRDGRTRFFRTPLETVRDFHVNWARDCAQALHAPAASESMIRYVENVMPMDTRITRMMLEHVAGKPGRSWKRAVTGIRSMSEYTLYGQFIDHVRGPHRDMVFATEEYLCHTLGYEFEAPMKSSEDAFVSQLSAHHIAIGIQSNIGMSAARIDHLSNRLKAAAGLISK